MLRWLRSPRREVAWIALWLVPKQAAVPDVELTETKQETNDYQGSFDHGYKPNYFYNTLGLGKAPWLDTK